MPLTSAQINQLQSDVNAANAAPGNAALRANYYNDVAQFGDPYGDLAAGVATNSTLDGVIANTFLQDTAASQYGVNLTPDQMSAIGNQLMNADFAARAQNQYATTLTPQQISDYHTEVFKDNGLGAGVWTEALPFEISPSTLTMAETGGIVGTMAVFGMMITAAHVDPDAPATPTQSAAQAWLGAVTHGLMNYLGNQGSAAGSAFVKALLGLFGLGKQDPLIIDVSGNGLNLESESLATPYFDFTGNGMASNTAWIGAGNGFLAITGADGLVDNGTDLVDTFAQLQALDSNGDRVINASDPTFSKLVVWEDLNGNGVCEANEVFTLAQLGIVSIALNAITANTVVNGSTILETATVTMADGTTREIAQVDLNASTTYTRYVGPQTVSTAAALLPQVQGYGTLMDLQHAMSAAPQLLADVQALLTVNPASLGAFDAAVQTILYEWAGVTGLAANGRGSVFDGQKLAVLEALSGQPYVDAHGNTDPGNATFQAFPLNQAWNAAFSGIEARLLVQDPASVLASQIWRPEAICGRFPTIRRAWIRTP